MIKNGFCIGKYVSLISFLTPIADLETGEREIQDFLLDNFLNKKRDYMFLYDCIILLKRFSKELSRRRVLAEQKADFISRLP